MQADQTVYLYPRRAELLGASARWWWAGTTIRRGAGGGPHDGRSAGEAEAVRVVGFRRCGWRCRSGGWRAVAGLGAGSDDSFAGGGCLPASPESLVFPGWRAEAIHEAMNEAERSVRTNEILEGLGRVLGSRDGTGAGRRCADAFPAGPEPGGRRAQGPCGRREEGPGDGVAEGRRKGQAEGRAGMVPPDAVVAGHRGVGRVPAQRPRVRRIAGGRARGRGIGLRQRTRLPRPHP